MAQRPNTGGAIWRENVPQYKFRLELGEDVESLFENVSGMNSETEVITHKIVDQKGNPNTYNIPGRENFGELTLKRGITNNMDIWDWRAQVVRGDMSGARTNGSIVALNVDGSEAARWDFFNAWPSKITGTELITKSDQYAIEELVIVLDSLERVATE